MNAEATKPTDLIYLKEMTLLQSYAQVLEVSTDDKVRTVIILDQTIFYPQGGGQPYDTGTIKNATATFVVEEVRFVEGLVRHSGHFEGNAIIKGAAVTCLVDERRRLLNCKYHSAGHVIDMALLELGLNWSPFKGHHFSNGAYVEYVGSLEGVDKEKLKTDIENLCKKYCAEDRTVKIVFMEHLEMKAMCHYVPETLPAGKPGRVVLFGDFGVPCGGTHVAHLGDIKGITIRKIKAEGDHVKIGYDVV